MNKKEAYKYHKASNGNDLVWCDDWGYGYLHPDSSKPIYDIEYWNNYQKLKESPMGKALTDARIKLVKKFIKTPEDVLDIGVGNGQFVEEFGCWGSDVNPHAIKWLKSIDRYATPDYDCGFSWFTMWDVIEHIDIQCLIEMFKHNHKGVILSTPIYKSFDDCIKSKHFKPNEHIWYFTTYGIIKFMEQFGYRCVEVSSIETKLGRESIGSFVFLKN